MYTKITKEEFQETFPIGSEFYEIQSWRTKPVGYTKYIVLGYSRYTQYDKNELLVHVQDGPYEMTRFISDCTNQWHGVFKTEAEAAEYYEEKLNEFNNSPEWQAEYNNRTLWAKF